MIILRILSHYMYLGKTLVFCQITIEQTHLIMKKLIKHLCTRLSLVCVDNF